MLPRLPVRKRSDRGHADHGLLRIYHNVSFADYYDQQEMDWGSLRDINEDRVQSGKDLGTHGHRLRLIGSPAR
jgi:redox-sensitive bicupin YhaK (pirin superfamily)